MARIYAYVAMALIAAGLVIGVWTLGRNRPEDSPRLGMRGKKRQRALEEGGLFASTEPAIRMVAGWIAYFPLTDQRRKVDELLKHAGDWLGLTANEFFALCALGSVGMGLMGLLLANLGGFPGILFVPFAALGALMPYLQVTGERDRRFKECNRALPGSIDLASLCMGAGLDFPGAIRQIVDKSGNREDALHEQWETVLQELELGRTRRQALENFADRVPTEAVRDFVSAVVQSEEKGNPLAEVLRIQATMMRMRRSVMAEEAAARAAILMMGPLMLIFGCIILCLMGPFIIQGMQTDAF
ncbi:type II secretion system F family protein [Sandaracinus amylolyticus]|uniref:Type II/IV secretion system protein TadC, associated with Flp pilus assembly n=1 Tax=Sandaracinus amylolyticus TaxID=927083 RepID=A0A0F6SI67_9BACT|nr:type II secretion system F family protein [Sandaracinus amylolyticus]AKF11664.1 Type II/IV secretion system protein TadC, associated with Flp pilus assembly [Sandaracinus amylolyticus]